MNALEIVSKKISTEGFPVDEFLLRRHALLQAQNAYLFHYDRVVFVVDRTRPVLHLYADDSGAALLQASRQFIADVWPSVPYQFLIAPIINPRVMRLATRFGFRPGEMLASGHTLYRLDRRHS